MKKRIKSSIDKILATPEGHKWAIPTFGEKMASFVNKPVDEALKEWRKQAKEFCKKIEPVQLTPVESKRLRVIATKKNKPIVRADLKFLDRMIAQGKLLISNIDFGKKADSGEPIKVDVKVTWSVKEKQKGVKHD